MWDLKWGSNGSTVPKMLIIMLKLISIQPYPTAKFIRRFV